MKTILHIAKYYHPYIGGIETVVRSLVEGMSDYRNIVVCFSSNGLVGRELINGIEVYRAKVNFTLMSQSIAFKYAEVLKDLFERYRPDFCHIHCPNPFLYPMVLRIIPKNTKLIVHWHSDILSKEVVYRLIKPFENAILNRADAIIATSPGYISGSRQLTKYKSKVSIVPNGITTSKFTLQSGDEECIKEIKSRYNGKKIVLFVGRHVPYKGIEHLLRAEKYIKNDCAILIGGTGPMDSYLKSLPYSDKVKFIGYLTDDALRCHLYAADIFAFPSVKRAEAFGLALAEAMYCYTAPITFTINESGVNWVSIAKETGEQVPLGDDKAFAAAIDKLLSDETLLQKYKSAAHNRVIEFFTEEESTKEMLNVYANL